MTRIVGIDLGTTNSLIGVVQDEAPRLLTGDGGSELLPSVVGVEDGRVVVGRTARNRRLLDPAGTVVSVKRKMGSKELLRLGQQQLSPEGVSALILGALLDRAEAELGERPERAVITVPAYFNEAQRQATLDAGKIAGLVVERLVHEPTAAAMTFSSGSEELMLVYDLGGGTFDVSVLEREDDYLEVRASHGDTQLGGDDIDALLVEHALSGLGKERDRVAADAVALTRLYDAVERAKFALSEREEVQLSEPFLAGSGANAVHLDATWKRSEIERLVRPLVQKTLEHVDHALRDAKVDRRDLTRAILVGGSSKMPLVQRLIAEHLGREAYTDTDADRAIGLGATILAGRLEGHQLGGALVDITPHSIAVGAVADEDDLYENSLTAIRMIPRGSVLPARAERLVQTLRDDQDYALVPLAQGEFDRFERNNKLGELSIGPLPPGPAGSPVAIELNLTLSGTLQCKGRHVPSGVEAEVEIKDSPYRLTQAQRDAAKQVVENLRSARESDDSVETEGRASPADVALANAMLARAEKALQGLPDSEESNRGRQLTEQLRDAIEAKRADLNEFVDAVSDVLLDLSD